MIILGERSRATNAAARWARILGLVAVMLAVLIAGCSGGSSHSSGTVSTGLATISGTIVVDNQDATSSTTALSGITVNYTASGNAPITALTASNGTFSLSVLSGTAGKFTIGTGSAYYDQVTYSANGTKTVGSAAVGLTIPAQITGASYSLGTIILTPSSGPPPPPAI